MAIVIFIVKSLLLISYCIVVSVINVITQTLFNNTTSIPWDSMEVGANEYVPFASNDDMLLIFDNQCRQKEKI